MVRKRARRPCLRKYAYYGLLLFAGEITRPYSEARPSRSNMRYAARAILATLKGKARRPFRYVDKGSLATIGRAAAVGEIGRFHLSGF